jgi:hypothetical protein
MKEPAMSQKQNPQMNQGAAPQENMHAGQPNQGKPQMNPAKQVDANGGRKPEPGIAQKQQSQGGESRNEGEGNRTAAKQYNKETTQFAQSGAVDRRAKEAEQALDGAEGDALRRAEDEGRRHSHGEDPALRAKGGSQH